MNFLPLVTYLLVMSIAPGPNNLVLATSGANFGFARTVPALSGMAFGLALQVGLLTVFLGSLVSVIASFQLYLALAGCAYLLWLSWGMLHAGQVEAGACGARPMGFFGGILFNWLNPNVWLIGFNLAMLFLPHQMTPWHAGVLFSLVTFAVVSPCIALWACSGVMIGRFLGSAWRRRLFNAVMAAMLAATAFWLVWRVLPVAFINQLNLMI